MSRYLLNALAIQDLEEISDQFAKTSIEAGERFFQEFQRKCRLLVSFANSGKSYNFIRPGLRGLPVDGYIIFYRLLEDGVEILRVLSGRRDLPALFQKPE
ncbi:type II toxin-antitoxin system RelE/ParE family toxin [Gloeobacter kilaueensis]|uniref:Plasmid stabilization system n=1 Tax=Gloeobacter kilaueensis (strain ATCC BAA-2537 / CCAP 1431/1 / ULC 316 / JS1) TaxID=1183438 RepID=U5QHC3_GLOK1|nr:type II toxin-antitoxin system RelE/ParE family toxin [Gloeobacter kilaueensis]AGY58301.1 plasmid stabilization system [Gloeobacter kilaueensis JS1]